jgi:hypothetical protein
MANITTILGTDSVSSSRIVINNNFSALNSELLNIAGVLNTTTQALTLTGLITGGTLRIYDGSNLFKVDSTEIIANLPIKLNQEVVLGNGLIYSVDSNPTTLPIANAYDDTTYVLNSTTFNTTILLAAADEGQEITLIADGGSITISNSNIIGIAASVVMSNGGSLTLRYIGGSIAGFVIISAFKCTVSGTAI